MSLLLTEADEDRDASDPRQIPYLNPFLPRDNGDLPRLRRVRLGTATREALSTTTTGLPPATRDALSTTTTGLATATAITSTLSPRAGGASSSTGLLHQSQRSQEHAKNASLGRRETDLQVCGAKQKFTGLRELARAE